jgi:hypothetical protein
MLELMVTRDIKCPSSTILIDDIMAELALGRTVICMVNGKKVSIKVDQNNNIVIDVLSHEAVKKALK